MQKPGEEEREKKMRKMRKFYIRTFQCPDCGQKICASKIKDRTNNGHIKTLYCPWCKADKEMEQIGMEKCR